MSIDKLQERIRKLKNPTVVDLNVDKELIPPYLLESEGDFLPAYERFCTELMDALKGVVPAVRFSFGYFALLRPDGVSVLARLTKYAKERGYYVFLDGPEMLSGQTAVFAADALLNNTCELYFDALILVSYIGSDGLRPYMDRFGTCDKDLFLVLRTANRSASELQDLLTGSRLVCLARCDSISRFSEMYIGRYGYSRISVMAAASSFTSISALRSKYKYFFVLLDGFDYTTSSVKNCSAAFDKLGHGAIVCAGASVTGAWRETDADGWQFADQAVMAAEKMKKNIARFVTVL